MKSKKIILVCALILLFAGGVMTYAWYPQYRGEQLVRNELIDPDSAVFMDVKYVRETKGLCGQVNGKNSTGGYVGFHDFYVDADGKVVFEPLRDAVSRLMVSRLESMQRQLEYLKGRVKVCPDEVGK
ncbi:hypothetical protein ACO0LC_18680 [Undibacterium sp. JH2W]|uniref:hypothetical protein n=1 Tax=Undibacterium sp. JH2W TaxID=3413037 RepID=UPI003BF15BFD